MKAITQSEDKTELHSVRSKKKIPFFKKAQNEEQKNKSDKKPLKKPFKLKSKGCFRCGGSHDKSTESVQPILPNVSIVASRDITLRCALKGIIRGFIR